MRNSPQVILLSIAIVTAGCSGSGGSAGHGGNGDPGKSNQPPTIAGKPDRSVLQGNFYEFRPKANDTDGDALTFGIDGKPGWAQFDSLTGRLYGTPDGRDTGTFRNIKITVSDGRQSASLNFSIDVNQTEGGVVTLSWLPPTENADGTVLTDLAGYYIYFGRTKKALDHRIALDNPGLTRYVVDNLSPAKWHFSMTSVNRKGKESKRSSTVSKKVA